MNDGPRYYGKYRATVINNLDPENRGRVQVQLADRFGTFPSTWALPAFQMAAVQCGMVALPPVHATVWIEFEAGDPDFPIWSGGFFESPAEMPAMVQAGATPATPNIVMQTVGQVTLMLSDNPAMNVMLKTLSGAMISIGESGILISNGKGASISMVGPSVIVNGGALTVT